MGGTLASKGPGADRQMQARGRVSMSSIEIGRWGRKKGDSSLVLIGKLNFRVSLMKDTALSMNLFEIDKRPGSH